MANEWWPTVVANGADTASFAAMNTAESRSLAETAQLHRQILDRLGPAPLAEDQLIRDLAAPSDAVAPALTDLEIDGRIRRQPGGLLSLV